MVYGFPGRTNEYIMSDAVKYIAQKSNPHKINLRTKRLDIQNKYMAQDPAIRIQYASKNASVANSWKKWQGEMKGILKMNTIANKQEFEKNFTRWADGKPEYAGIVEKFKDLYAKIEDLSLVNDYQNEAINAVELVSFAGRGGKNAEKFHKDYYMPIDKESFITLYNEYNKNISDTYKSPYFKEKLAQYGSIEKWADAIFTTQPNLQLAEELYKQTNEYFSKTLNQR
jgi:Peptidase S46